MFKSRTSLLVAAALTCLGMQAALAETRFESAGQELRAVEVLGGLEHPWSLAFLPDGRMLVTERDGRLLLVSEGQAQPVKGVPEVLASGQGGLLEVAVHPDFASNGLVFLTFSAPSSGGATTHLLRAKLAGDSLTEQRVIFTAEPGSGTTRHFGSRIVFDGNGHLYLSVGDRGEMGRAQDRGDLAGKIVRIDIDGRAPADNPFAANREGLAEIYAYGVRNPQGLALNPWTGELWEHEHGPRGGDEINIIRPGRNYGWPVVTHGINYNMLPIGEGKTKPGIEDPIHTWVPSIAPSGMAFYTAVEIPGWQGDLLVGALAAQQLVRLDLDGDRIVGEERLLDGELGRIRDVRVGPDGLVYLLTDEANGALFRIEPMRPGPA
ncbi:MAG: PQQ-dependent sugar dehydrogenase [Geminicoccaceae bacterium]